MAGEAPLLDLEVSILQRGREHKWLLRELGENFVNGSDPKLRNRRTDVPIHLYVVLYTFQFPCSSKSSLQGLLRNLPPPPQISLRDTPLDGIFRHATQRHLHLYRPWSYFLAAQC